MNIQQLRRIIRQESPSRLADGIVVSIDARGTRTASVRVSGGHVHSRVYTCDDTLEIGDQVVIARLEGLARMVVIGKIVSQHGSSLSEQGILAPPNNFTALTFAGVTYCQWDTYPGDDLSWEVQYSLAGSPYADATQVLVSRGSYYLYPCDSGTTVYFRARAIRWLGDNNLMYSGWSSWASVTCSGYEIPRLLVELTNKAGKQVEEGWVVVIDLANASSFKTTVTADDEDVIGVAFETIADEAVGLICISGLVDVYASDAPAIGDYLISSVTEGNATGDVTATKGAFGRALMTKTGNTVTAIIDPPIGAGAGAVGHDLLSAEHLDTLADAVVQGDMIVGTASPLWARLPKGAANLILKMNAGGTDPEWGEPPITSIAGHARGSIFRGEAADWGIYDAKTDKQILVGDGIDIVSVPVSQDVTLANTGAATVIGIQARAVAAGAPADGQVYAWDNVASEWASTDQFGGGNPAYKADGALIVATVVDGCYICTSDAKITAVYIYCATPGTAGSTIVDVNKNGVTIFTVQGNRPTLAWNDADQVAKSGVPDVIALAENDVLTIDIDQVATGAQDLTVIIALTGGGGGGGVGDSTYTDTYAARPAASNDGDLFLPSDGFVIERDTGTAWVPWGPIFPFKTPVDGDFAWINQGIATVDTAHGGIHLSSALVAGGVNMNIRKKAAPSPPYTITAAFCYQFEGRGNYPCCGLLFRQSSDGKLAGITIEMRAGVFLMAGKYTSPTVFTAAYITKDYHLPSLGFIFLRIEDDNTDRKVWWSGNGQHWWLLHSVGRTDFLTADEVGFTIQPRGYGVGMTLLSWEEA